MCLPNEAKARIDSLFRQLSSPGRPPKKQPGPEQSRIRVLLVDSHRLMRDGMRALLESATDMKVVGDVGDGATALRLIGRNPPDVVVISLALPDGDGLEIALGILRQYPDTRIVIHSCLFNRDYLKQVLAAGIRNCVQKGERVGDLLAAIRCAVRREPYLSQELSAMLIEAYQDLRAYRPPQGAASLSSCEIEILKLMANGHNTKEIADKIGRSVKTVDYYRKRIMSKLGVNNVAELIKYAIRKGLTSA